MTDLIDRLGVSRSSVQRICRTFKKEGVAGLITRQCKKGRPRMMLAEKALYILWSWGNDAITHHWSTQAGTEDQSQSAKTESRAQFALFSR